MLRPDAPVNEDVYLPFEIATAAGVPLEQVVAAVGGEAVFVRHGAAILLGRRLAGLAGPAHARPRPLFATFYKSPGHAGNRVPFMVTAAVHACLIAAAVAVAAAGHRTSGPRVQEPTRLPFDDVRLVFLAEVGPGGGGGGGGLKQLATPGRAETRGRLKIGNPIARRTPVPAEPPATLPPLAAEPFPVVVAPIAPAAAGARDRLGSDEITEVALETHGAGSDGGVGTGIGDGIGAGRGAGLGDGAGGGTGGGVFRAGSGVEPPRVIREMKADYPDEARRRGIEGDVVIELVVRRDGSVGDARIVRRLSAALDEQALRAVRQWRFQPGKYRGSPVDVAVEVVVEFRLR
jgi:TonB family protein